MSTSATTTADAEASIRAQLSQIHANIAELEAELERAGLAFARTPDDIDLEGHIQSTQQRLDKAKARRELFEAALREATAELGREAEADRIHTAVSARDEALQLSSERVTLAKHIDGQRAKLRKAEDRYRELGRQIGSAVRTVEQHAVRDPDTRRHWALQVSGLAHGPGPAEPRRETLERAERANAHRLELLLDKALQDA